MSQTLLSSSAAHEISQEIPGPNPLQHPDRFARRHIGPSVEEIGAMLQTLGKKTVGELIDEAVPASIRFHQPLRLGPERSEHEMLHELRSIADQNQVFKSYIGMGYS